MVCELDACLLICTAWMNQINNFERNPVVHSLFAMEINKYSFALGIGWLFDLNWCLSCAYICAKALPHRRKRKFFALFFVIAQNFLILWCMSVCVSVLACAVWLRSASVCDVFRFSFIIAEYSCAVRPKLMLNSQRDEVAAILHIEA